MTDLQQSRDDLCDIYRNASMMGIQYSELMNMDLRTYIQYSNGYTMRREQTINDSLFVGHVISGKISQAVWGAKEFNDPIEKVCLTDHSLEAERRRKAEEILGKHGCNIEDFNVEDFDTSKHKHSEVGDYG